MSEPVQGWAPPIRDSLKLVRRPFVAYGIFAAGGIISVIVTILAYGGSGEELWQVPLFFGVGLMGIPAGQLASLTRLRIGPAAAAWFVLGTGFLVLCGMTGMPEEITVPGILFGMGFASGFLSLQHRFELFAAFLPALGWVGSIMVILNEEGRVSQWHDEKVSAWLPVPLFLLLCFTVGFGAYLVQKQAQHLELWQLLGGAPSRRLTHKGRGKIALGGRGIAALLVLCAGLFVFSAVISPYLWRTGRGDHDGDGDGDGDGGGSSDGGGGPGDFDVDGLKRALEEFGEQAKDKSTMLLPILPLLLLERPLRRWIVLRHLRRPFWRKPPSDRIDDLWRYVRVSLGDAKLEPRPSDSVEQAVARVEAARGAQPDLAEASRIYARTRYGLGVARGDVERLRQHAQRAFAEVRKPLTGWQRVKSWYRRVD